MIALVHRISIRTKIAGSFSLVTLLVVGLGVMTIDRLARIDSIVADVRDNWMPSVHALGKLLDAVDEFRIEEARYAQTEASQ